MSDILNQKKIAIVHDWITGMGGAEKVLKSLNETLPNADVYALFTNDDFAKKFIQEKKIITTHLQKKFGNKEKHKLKLVLPLIPSAVESINLEGYDLVISTGPSYSKGLILPLDTLHVAYCHSPTRFLWDWTNQHLAVSGIFSTIKKTARHIAHHIFRIWDRVASQRVDYYIANSKNIEMRIKKYYKRNSRVIYPPVSLAKDSNPINYTANKDLKFKNYFLIVSRLYKHKNIDIAIKAFNRLGWNLVVIGDGPEYSRLKAMAGPTVYISGYLDDNIVATCYSLCDAFIMPQEEDFGIAPIEALSYGKPVLALKKGGAMEYIKEGVNGEFFDDPNEAVLAYGVHLMRSKIKNNVYNKDVIIESVKKFSEDRFKKEIKDFLIEKLYAHGKIPLS